MQAVHDAMPEDMNENGNYILKVGLISQENGNLSGAKKLFEQMQTFFTKLLDLSSASSSDSGQTAMSIRSDGSETGTGSLSQNKKSQILDELQQMIQLMIQQMLKELMGDDSYEEVSTENDEEEKIAAESVTNNDEHKETAAESLTETKEPSVSEEETMEDDLNLENAQVL